MTEALVRRPLADRMRPRSIDEFQGQSHLLAPGKPLRMALETGPMHSMVLWGPPGTGKTTLARIAARCLDARFVALSAVLAGVKDVRLAVDEARKEQKNGRQTVLFVDEVHRFNKAQQDAFLPHLEDGTLILIGATTENPSFALNNALLSRTRVYVLRPLDDAALEQVLEQALRMPGRGFDQQVALSEPARLAMLRAADGDARCLLTLLEIAVDLCEPDDDGMRLLGIDEINEISAGSLRRFDRGGDLFYDQISAMHKAVRGSSPDGALYWFQRMLDGGCDPEYIARRMLRMASEDIGNADPRALALCLDAWSAYQRLGSPEGELALAQALIYLASAAKSNAVYSAFGEAQKDARANGTLEVPLHLRNAPTRLLKELGHGRDYRYAHDETDAFAAGVDYLPEELAGRIYYRPVARGLEIRIGDKLQRLRELDRQARARQGGHDSGPD